MRCSSSLRLSSSCGSGSSRRASSSARGGSSRDSSVTYSARLVSRVRWVYCPQRKPWRRRRPASWAITSPKCWASSASQSGSSSCRSWRNSSTNCWSPVTWISAAGAEAAGVRNRSNARGVPVTSASDWPSLWLKTRIWESRNSRASSRPGGCRHRPSILPSHWCSLGALAGSSASTLLNRRSRARCKAERATGSMSGLDSHMQGDNAAGHVVILATYQACIFHHTFQGFLVGVHADRLGQIAIAFAVACNQGSHQRECREGVGVVDLGEYRVVRLGELQHQQAATGLEYPGHGRQGLVFVGHVTQAEGDGDAVEVVIRKRQAFRIGLDVFDIAAKAPVDEAVTPDLQHGLINVCQHYCAGLAHQAGKLHGQIAGAAGNVQDPVAFPDPAHLDGEALPNAMDAHGHQVVHQVVT